MIIRKKITDEELFNDPQKSGLLKEYYVLKERFNKVENSETLRKYRILSKAYRIGKEIYGRNYSIRRLSLDFDIPYTTVKRVTSLNRATPRTWELIKSGKLSAYKAAQICSTKDKTFQDDIIKLVIGENLSTYQIKRLRIHDSNDLRRERLRLAVDRKFARSDTAWLSIQRTIYRLFELLNLSIDDFPPIKRKIIINRLEDLTKKIEKFIFISKQKIEDKIYKPHEISKIEGLNN